MTSKLSEAVNRPLTAAAGHKKPMRLTAKQVESLEAINVEICILWGKARALQAATLSLLGSDAEIDAFCEANDPGDLARLLLASRGPVHALRVFYGIVNDALNSSECSTALNG